VAFALPVSDDLDVSYARLAAEQRLLPVKVTPFYKAKVDAEVAALGGNHGPLYRAVYPTADRFLRAPNEVRDWVDDRSNMPGEGHGFIVQKYVDRVLFMPTSVCAAHCLYCFRQDVLTENKANDEAGLDAKLEALVEHLKARPDTREVILSGGDPMMLPLAALEKIFAALQGVETVQEIRIHSRAPIFAPAIMSDDKIALLAANNVRFVFHSIHPYEICDDVAAMISRMNKAGIRLYNHFPLLRKINDHADVLIKLIQRLTDLNVHTFSIYVPEPIYYSAAYRIGFRRAAKLIDAVKAQLPGWADFRFCLDTPYGKVRREHLIAEEASTSTLVFQYEGKRIRYPDFPEPMDEAGDLKTLLWKACGV
jgi:lysine 2,3-aminomutase